MKIVDYETFIRLPAGTIYAEYKPDIFIDWREKMDGGKLVEFGDKTIGWAFLGARSVMPDDSLENYVVGGELTTFHDKQYLIDNKYQADSLCSDEAQCDYDGDELFAVLSADEIEKFALRLLAAANKTREYEIKTRIKEKPS